MKSFVNGFRSAGMKHGKQIKYPIARISEGSPFCGYIRKIINFLGDGIIATER